MLKRLIAAVAIAGVAAVGCSSPEPEEPTTAADARLVYFTGKETRVLNPAINRYRSAYAAAVKPATINRCNRALDSNDVTCFKTVTANVDKTLDRLSNITPARGGYHPKCRAGLKKWLRFLADYREFSQRLREGFAAAEYKPVTRSIKRYPKLIDYDARLNGKRLPRLVAACYPQGTGEKLLRGASSS